MLIIYPSCLVIECISVQVGLVKMFLGLLQLGGREMVCVCVCVGGGGGGQRERERTEERESGRVGERGMVGL